MQSSLVGAGTWHQVPWLVDFEGRRWDEPAGREAMGWRPLHRLYRAADRTFALGAADARELETVEGLEGVSGLASERLATELERRFATTDAGTWVRWLLEAGVAAQVCRTVEELMADPTAQSRGLSIVREHPGVGPVRSIGPGPRMSLTPVRAGRPVGLPGADTAAVLAEAGIGDVERLEASGAAAGRLASDAPLML